MFPIYDHWIHHNEGLWFGYCVIILFESWNFFLIGTILAIGCTVESTES